MKIGRLKNLFTRISIRLRDLQCNNYHTRLNSIFHSKRSLQKREKSLFNGLTLHTDNSVRDKEMLIFCVIQYDISWTCIRIISRDTVSVKYKMNTVSVKYKRIRYPSNRSCLEANDSVVFFPMEAQPLHRPASDSFPFLFP